MKSEAINPLKESTRPMQSKAKPMPKDVQGLLKDDRIQSELALALPRHMSPDRLARIALTEFRKTPKLKECIPASFLGAVVQCAQLGLEPGNSLGHAYILPYEKRAQINGQWQTVGVEAQLIIGYRGMIDLARRSGQIISLQAHAVYEGDDFDFAYGLDERLHHVPTGSMDERGEIKAVYAVAKLKGGGHQIEVMWLSEVLAIRERSKAKDNGPWKTDFEEMAKKTVIRRLFKYLPVSIEIQQAVSFDERAESGHQSNAAYFGEITGHVYEGELVDGSPDPSVSPAQESPDNEVVHF